MENVNYITHLNTVFDLFNNDDRIKQGHITLYLAFFQKWNRKFFKKIITVNRQFIMENAKIKSKTTYHNYLKDLNSWGYLQYFPSYHPARGSKIKMTIYGTSSGTSKVQNLARSDPKPSQNMVSSYKQKTLKNLNKMARPFNEEEVLLFFKTNNWEAIEGKKFYAYYQARDWKLSRGFKIKDWKLAASNYVEKGFKIKEEYTSPISDYLNNLRNNKDEDYSVPL